MSAATEQSTPVYHREVIPAAVHIDHHDPDVAHHFTSYEQQREVFTLGMWAFLAQEVMFFGGLFTAYGVYRYVYHDAFIAGSQSLSVLWGGINTTVLLLSSFSMAMSVYYCQVGKIKSMIGGLFATLFLGALFLGIKWVFEWTPKFEYGALPGTGFGPDAHHYPGLVAFASQAAQNVDHLEIFFFLYFVMTGMHALHMIIGGAILLVIIAMAMAGQFGPRRYATIENFGLYWHFVDIVWVFLFPLFYLVG